MSKIGKEAVEKVNNVVFPGARLTGGVTILARRFRSENALKRELGRISKMLPIEDMNWMAIKFPNKESCVLYFRCLPKYKRYETLLAEEFIDLAMLPDKKVVGYADGLEDLQS